VVIEREGEPNARPLHDGKARRIHGRELVQVRAPEVFPRLRQIAQFAGQNLDRAGLMDRIFPCQRYVPVGIAFEESECLDNNRDGGVKFRAGSMQGIPLLPGLRVQRITRKRKGDPRAAIDEHRLPLPHHGSS
jgi:hypothetical protein